MSAVLTAPATKMGEPAGAKSCRFKMPNREAPMANQYRPQSSWSSLAEKIESRLDGMNDPHGCWIWTGAKSGRGYGSVWWDAKLHKVHRAYLKELGVDVPEGMDVDHLCRNTSCANPDHLEVVTHQVNTQRGLVGTWDRGDFCKRGHEFTPQNTRITPNGHRSCRTCHREHNARRVVCDTCGAESSVGNIAAHRRLHERSI